MEQLPTKSLAEYIRHAIDLESHCLMQEELIEDYDDTAEDMEPVYTPEPLPCPPYQQTIPVPPLLDRPFQSSKFDTTVFFWIVSITTGIVTLLLGFILLAEDGISISEILVTFAIGIAFLVCAIMIKVSVRNKYEEAKAAYDTQFESQKQRFLSEFSRVEQQNASNESKHKIELARWQERTQRTRKALTAKLEETRHTLTEYYSADIVHPKYRNLPALSSLYEYLTTVRCTELVGPNGAYNLYESELRANIVIAQLNTVLANLESIRQNQFVLYDEINKVNANLEQVTDELCTMRGLTASLVEITALNAYYNSVTASSTSAMEFYHAIGM